MLDLASPTTAPGRQRLIDVAAEEIYRAGFQAASVGDILKSCGLSKGAFYHHFQSKKELGLAVLDEVFVATYKEHWNPIFEADDPLAALIEFLRGGYRRWSDEQVRNGCPLGNIAQEMSPIDESFRLAVGRILESWRASIAQALGKSRAEGLMDRDADVQSIACLVLATVEGASSLTKNAQDVDVFRRSVSGLADYLESLAIPQRKLT